MEEDRPNEMTAEKEGSPVIVQEQTDPTLTLTQERDVRCEEGGCDDNDQLLTARGESEQGDDHTQVPYHQDDGHEAPADDEGRNRGQESPRLPMPVQGGVATDQGQPGSIANDGTQAAECPREEEAVQQHFLPYEAISVLVCFAMFWALVWQYVSGPFQMEEAFDQSRRWSDDERGSLGT
jgi:hypothetical protein